MNNSSENIEKLIELYVKGQLVGKELIHFESLMANDESLREAVAEEQTMFELFVDKDVLDLKNMMKTDFTPPTSSNQKYWWASGLLLLSVSGLLLIQKNNLDKESTSVTKEITFVQDKVENKSQTEFEVTEIQEPTKKVESKSLPNTISILEEKKTVEKTVFTDSDIKTEAAIAVEKQTEKATPIAVNKNEQPREIASQDPCSTVSFKGNSKTTHTLSGSETGSISIDEFEISGGKKPYSYALNQSKEFKNQGRFSELSKGKYSIYIKDDNGCINTLQSVVILETMCLSSYQQTFNVAYESEWKIPVIENEAVRISLVNRVGTVLYEKNIISERETLWDGILKNGQKVEPDGYKWIIEYEKGEKCLAKMTVLK